MGRIAGRGDESEGLSDLHVSAEFNLRASSYTLHSAESFLDPHEGAPLLAG